MELVVIRHAIAVERSPEIEDADRQLTERGRRRFKQVVRGLRALDLRLDRILSSPWRRAAETADLALPLLRGGGSAAVCAHLVQSPKAELLSAIAETAAPRVAVIGHEPWLGELIALLTTGEQRHGETIPLKKGGVAILEGAPTPGGMQLRALLPPRVLRRLA
jgi:phosphohistidine phosphatase